MHIEKERRFLLTQWQAMNETALHQVQSDSMMTQVYLSDPEDHDLALVRGRLVVEKQLDGLEEKSNAWLTIKAKSPEGTLESEFPMPVADLKKLIERGLYAGEIIVKRRQVYQKNGFACELDTFLIDGNPSGLYIMEVEHPECEKFDAGEFTENEITGISSWSNSNISTIGVSQASKMAKNHFDAKGITAKPMKFELDEDEATDLEVFRRTHYCGHDYSAIGGRIVVSFVMTGIGTFPACKCSMCGETKNLGKGRNP